MAVGKLAEGAGDIGFDSHIGAGPHAFHVLQRAGQRYAVDIINSRQRGPEAVLILAPHRALEIDPPALPLGVAEFQRLEGNGDLGRPPVFHHARLDGPHRIPVFVDLAAFIGYLRIPLGSAGVDGKLIAIALVVEGIEDDLKRIA